MAGRASSPGRGLPSGGDRSRLRRCARARGRAACDAPRAPGTASHLAQRSWAEPPWRASATGESNTFSLNFPAPVPANTHSTHTHARSESLSQASGLAPVALWPRLSLSVALIGAEVIVLFIYFLLLAPSPAPHLPPCLLLLPPPPP